MIKLKRSHPQIAFLRTLSGLLSGAFFLLNPPILWAQLIRVNRCQPVTLQTDVSNQDLANIERFVNIAQKHSAEILDAKAALGFSAFQDVVSLELEPSLSLGTSDEEYGGAYTESSFSSTITVDPIRLIGIFQKFPALRARLKQTKSQKRVEVVKYYVAYIQARQKVQIVGDRMGKSTGNRCIHDLNMPSPSKQSAQNLTAKEDAEIAVEQLNASGNVRLALEELAACVGLSPQETIAILENPASKQSP
jgi:outer membrane protein TolC